jgi:hypothetical protein
MENKTKELKEPMIEPIEEVVGAVADLEKKPENPVMIEEKPLEEEIKPPVAVVSTVSESPDFKSIVKTPLEVEKGKESTKKRRKCKRGSRRNKRTHRCRKKKGSKSKR